MMRAGGGGGGNEWQLVQSLLNHIGQGRGSKMKMLKYINNTNVGKLSDAFTGSGLLPF